MKAICFYFQIHQPFRLKHYRFFDIGNDHYYYDDFADDDIITRIAQRSYLPANQMLLDMIKENGKKFKVAFSISGTALEQLEQYVPEFIDSMKELAQTGCVEFLSETYAHSLSSLYDPDEFVAQVKAHDAKIYQLFGQKPKVFRNTELISTTSPRWFMPWASRPPSLPMPSTSWVGVRPTSSTARLLLPSSSCC